MFPQYRGQSRSEQNHDSKQKPNNSQKLFLFLSLYLQAQKKLLYADRKRKKATMFAYTFKLSSQNIDRGQSVYLFFRKPSSFLGRLTGIPYCHIIPENILRDVLVRFLTGLLYILIIQNRLCYCMNLVMISKWIKSN